MRKGPTPGRHPARLRLARLETAITAQHVLSGSLRRQLHERAAQLQALNVEAALAAERERRLLAQDLHDGLGQWLAVAKIRLYTLQNQERRGRVRAALVEIDRLIDQCNHAVRSLLTQLSPPVLHAGGLVPALEWLADEMGRVYGLQVAVECDGAAPVIEEPARTAIFRAIRELLINVAKHAGCETARIHCLSERGGITITVSDGGSGFVYEPAAAGRPGAGFGLISLVECIHRLGGEMRINTAPGCGTRIAIRYPTGAAPAGEPGGPAPP